MAAPGIGIIGSRAAWAFGCAATLTTLACAGPQTIVNASAPSVNAPLRGVVVNGTGKAMAAPDIARASVGVEVRAITADEAIREANTRMAQVVAALKAIGIAERDLKTNSVSLQFERNFEGPPRPVDELPPAAPPALPTKRPPAGPQTSSEPAPQPATKPKAIEGVYRATNMVEVTIRSLDRAGAVLSAATNAGANQLFGIQFEIEDPRPVEAEARQKAFEDARTRALGLAQLAGIKLGPPVSVTEMGGAGMTASSGPMMMMKEGGAADVPIERGEQTIYTSVQVVFELADD